jgi:predicted house-cleaning noncanonical NTP pyrophosphatase (MazG superfamily)
MKLVRDNIPNIILEKQPNCAYAECKDKELYKRLLENKLFEEAKEFIEDPSTLEAADILTVLYYLYINREIEKVDSDEPSDDPVFEPSLYSLDVFLDEIKEACSKKLESNGGFSKGYILLNREDYSRD